MAERRMFAKTIVTSDAFLDMPMSARCLYFTLGMFADDDGFVNSPKSIMRQVGATLDDMNILIAKKFILVFDSGVIVIKHWRINNYLRSDRYKETAYTEEKADLHIEENGAYTLCIPSGIPAVNQCETQYRIGKDSIGKSSKGKDKDIYSPADAEQIVSYLNEMCGTSYKANTKKTVDLIKARMNEGFTVEDFKTVIYKKAKQWKGDEKMVKFLRPVTLFSPKFESYLNEKEVGGRLDWLDEI